MSLSPSIRYFVSRVDDFDSGSSVDKSSRLKGPCRVIRFCILGVVVPVLLLAIPLYMRFVVYGEEHYPLTASDMRLIDNRISTTWCQSQALKMNASFNAYLMDDTPPFYLQTNGSIMRRNIVLEDDMKEYWGFYLLRGSTFTISTCARWTGASLMVVRGRHHLRYCAYIGDLDSEDEEESEEEDDEMYLDDLKQLAREANLSAVHGVQLNSKEIMDQIIRQMIELNQHGGGNVFSRIRKRMKEANIQVGDLQERLAMKSTTQADTTTTTTTTSEPITTTAKSAPHHRRRHHHAANTTTEQKQRRRNHKRNRQSKQLPQEPAPERLKRNAQDPWDADSTEDAAQEKVMEDELELLERIPGLPPRQTDGLAADSGRLNMTTDNDMSNSEPLSSFSSSEEAMLQCEGVIVTMPIPPDPRCPLDPTTERAIFTYQVPSTGYYYFIFDSQNEITDNLIQLEIELRRTVYELDKVSASCRNASECTFPLSFASHQKVVLQVPDVNEKADWSWDEMYIATSTCEPRVALYLVFALAVPVVILACAFN